MPTKAQLAADILELYSDAEKMRFALQERINELEDQANNRACDLEKAKAYLRPFFVPRAAGPMPITEGTAHCPVCDASAPGNLQWLNGPRVTTARPLEHREGCYFVEQREEPSTPRTLTGPDGEQLDIDLRDIVHMEPRIKYTTLVVKEGIGVRRVVVCEKVKDIRARRSAT